MSDALKFFSIAADVFGILLAVVAIWMLFVSKIPEEKTKGYFYAIFLTLLLALTSNMVGLLMKGHGEGIGQYILRTSNFCEYAFGYGLAYILSRYFTHIISGNAAGKLKKWNTLFTGVFCTSMLLLIVSQFNGMYYTIDAEGFYHRGQVFWLSQIFAVANMLLNAVLIILYRRELSKKERNAFFAYIAFPTLALIVQIYVYGIYLMLLFSTLSAIFMMIFIISDQTDKYIDKETELANLRCDVILSQIQPHFLYNALTAIYRLCDVKPEMAKTAVNDFSKYLRGNLDSIKQTNLISFSEEMKHTQAYLSLEKVRYEEDLEIVYDIQTDEFLLPPLTIEPLAENAVNHGIANRPCGGRVTISTAELPDCYEICVADNGVGFDTDTVPEDGRSHVGISAVRSRLQIMCGGTLTIHSIPGQGTTATVHIPKGA